MPVGLQLFASAQDEPRARRPTDVALAIIGLVLLVASRRRSRRSAATSTSRIADAAGVVPGLLRSAVAHPGVDARRVGRLAVRRRRRSAAGVRLPATSSPASWSRWCSPSFSPGCSATAPGISHCRCSPTSTARRRSRRARSTFAAAVISTASPHLSRPFRHFGRWIVGWAVPRHDVPRRNAPQRQRASPSPSGCSPPPSSTSSSARPAAARRRRGSSSPCAGSASTSSS